MRQVCCPKTSATGYQSILRNIPEERTSHLHRSGNVFLFGFDVSFVLPFW